MTTTLLAVDDSKTMRKVLEITFAGEDYTTVLADGSADALAKAQAQSPGIALIDAGLGNESGYDLCQQLKAQSPGTRVIILSSKHAPYDAAKGSAAGADDHHDKPFDTQQLLDKVAKVLGGAAAQPAAAAPAAAPAPAPAAPAPAPARAPAAAPAVRSPTLSFDQRAAPQSAQAAPRVAPAAAPRSNTLPGTPAPGREPPPAADDPRWAQGAPKAPTPAPAPARAPAPSPAPAPAAPAPAAPAAAAAAATSGNGQLAEKLAGLGLSQEQVDGVLALSRDVIEQVVWEVVPVIAETVIQEEIRRLTSD